MKKTVCGKPEDGKRLVSVRATIKLDAYAIIEEAVDRGVGRGVARAHKHSSKPDYETIIDQAVKGVMDELSSVIRWDYDA